MTLGRGITFSTTGCKTWIYWELIFAELMTFVVEIILVLRREFPSGLRWFACELIRVL